jgi:hypothetical protein
VEQAIKGATGIKMQAMGLHRCNPCCQLEVADLGETSQIHNMEHGRHEEASLAPTLD